MSMMLLTYFGVICDLLLSRSRVTWTCCFKWYRKQNVVWWHQLCICPPVMSKNHESVCILQLIIWRHSAYLSLQFFFGEFFVVLCFLTLRFSSLCTVNLFYFIVIYWLAIGFNRSKRQIIGCNSKSSQNARVFTSLIWIWPRDREHKSEVVRAGCR